MGWVDNGFFSLCSTFINKVFNFIGIGIALYTVALVYGWASNDSVIKHTVKCKYCRKRISEKVSCSNSLSFSASVFGTDHVM